MVWTPSNPSIPYVKRTSKSMMVNSTNNVLLVKIEGPVWYIIIIYLLLKGVLQTPLFSSTNQWEKGHLRPSHGVPFICPWVSNSMTFRQNLPSPPPNISGWCCNKHLEKYESQWLVDYPFFMMENKNVWNHQPVSKLVRKTNVKH